MTRNNKPSYAVPPLAEILAAPDNGLTHVSTFSGAGGTCLGFRLAGFRTLLANDCDARATACYRANLASPIDPRPIQQLTVDEILRLTGLARGELDVFEGSPPCTSFSTAGSRASGWGKTKEHAGVVQQKIEDLFFEWLRLLEGLAPRAFVAENVSGMVKGVAKGYFKLVLAEMKRLGYRTEARLLDAQWLGVPQQRQRIIFVGVREDLGLAPAFPAPLAYRYSIRDALPWIDDLRLGAHGFQEASVVRAYRPTTTVASTGMGSYDYDVGVVGNSNAAHAGKGKRSSADGPSPTLLSRCVNQEIETRVVDDAGRGFDHRSDPALTDPANAIVAGRVSQFVERRVVEEAPGPASRRGRKAPSAAPSPTVLSSNSGFSDIAAGVTRRKFTILEVKRLCSFPDDYDLAPAGSYAHQWARLGNSVPPMMAYRIAAALRDRLLELKR